MTSKELELTKAYKEYIEFLTDSYGEVFEIAHAHGYNCSQEDIDLGKLLRANIHKLESECIYNEERSVSQNLCITIDRS